MELEQVIAKRYSCRAYADRDVPADLVDTILHQAQGAPSAKNLQRTRVVVVRDAETRQKLVPAAKGQRFVGQAPVVLVFCSAGDNSHVMTCGHKSSPMDTAIFIDHVTLLCTAAGLATCWIGAFYADQVKDLLAIPPEVEVIELLPVGYPADAAPESRNRLPFAEIVHRERWDS